MYQSLNNLVKHYIKLIVNVIDKKPSTTLKKKQARRYLYNHKKKDKEERKKSTGMERSTKLYNIKTK